MNYNNLNEFIKKYLYDGNVSSLVFFKMSTNSYFFKVINVNCSTFNIKMI